MTGEEALAKREEIMKEMRLAAATMEKKSIITKLGNELKELQFNCPHFDAKLNFTIADNKCPYCGKTME